MKKQINNLILEKKPVGKKIGNEKQIRKMKELANISFIPKKKGTL